MAADQIKKLSEANLRVGDLVLYTSEKDSTGGVIYQISDDQPPVKIAERFRIGSINGYHYKKLPGAPAELPDAWDGSHDYSKLYKHYKPNQEWGKYKGRIDGLWDENGKKVLKAAEHGFVRINPIFNFFATDKGKNPSGKGKTIIIEYKMISYHLKKVDIVTLGVKYLELGNLIRDLARAGGAEL